MQAHLFDLQVDHCRVQVRVKLQEPDGGCGGDDDGGDDDGDGGGDGGADGAVEQEKVTAQCHHHH